MWISKHKLEEIIQHEIEVYLLQHTFTNEIQKEIKNAYNNDQTYTVNRAIKLYSETVQEIKKYVTSTELLLQIVEVINKVQIPELHMSKEERDMLS